MIYPKFIEKGNKIDVPAPSAGADDELKANRFRNAKSKLEELGYEVNLSANIFECNKGRSASAEVRANEVNEMFSSNSNAIICAAGGEFLTEIIPYVDFERLAKNPKWVMGFSDPTGLLLPITTKYDIATIYGANFSSFGMDKYYKDVLDNLDVLNGKKLEVNSYEFYENERVEKVTGLEGYNLTDKVYWKTLDGKTQNLKGRIIVGCLDIIMIFAGTKYDNIPFFCEKYKNDGIIFVFDNCELSKETVIRAMWILNELGYFKYAKGIIFGRNGLENSYYYDSMEECLKDSCISKLNIPIVYDADISHKGPSMPIINGSVASVCVANGKGNIKFSLE